MFKLTCPKCGNYEIFDNNFKPHRVSAYFCLKCYYTDYDPNIEMV